MNDQTNAESFQASQSGQSAPCAKAHVGVIDIGSNAIRLQVARLFDTGEFKVLTDDREPVRLGSEVFRTGTISPSLKADVLRTVGRFAAVARGKGVTVLKAVATSAMREADNGEELIQAIRSSISADVEIISGEREARLIARGVLSCFRSQSPRFVLADIGGGSTELSIIEHGDIRFAISLPLGSSRLTEMFCKSDPLSLDDERRLRAFVREELTKKIPQNLTPVPELVGSAGTFGAVGNFIRRKVSPATGQDAREKDANQSGARFNYKELRRACTCLSAMSIQERRATRGIEERRAEIIVAGTILLHEIASYFGVEHLRGARRGLRDGLMLEIMDSLRD